MKKFLHYMVVALVALGFATSCSNDDPETGPYPAQLVHMLADGVMDGTITLNGAPENYQFNGAEWVAAGRAESKLPNALYFASAKCYVDFFAEVNRENGSDSALLSEWKKVCADQEKSSVLLVAVPAVFEYESTANVKFFQLGGIDLLLGLENSVGSQVIWREKDASGNYANTEVIYNYALTSTENPLEQLGATSYASVDAMKTGVMNTLTAAYPGQDYTALEQALDNEIAKFKQTFDMDQEED